MEFVKIKPINVQEIKPIIIKVQPTIIRPVSISNLPPPITTAVVAVKTPISPLPLTPKKVEESVVISNDGLIKLPYFNTKIEAPPPKPVLINYDTNDLALAHDRRQKAGLILDTIIESKLRRGRASDSSIYNLIELKGFAELLGIKRSQSKDALIDEIKQLKANYKSAAPGTTPASTPRK